MNKYTYKKFEYLPEDAQKIREEVFVREQGFKNEFDDIDKTAAHIVVYDGELPVGVCRYYIGADGYTAGRIATIKSRRGCGLGGYIMSVIEENVRADGGTRITVSAQTRAAGFYESCGYTKLGKVYYDEYCPHIKMVKDLS